MAVTATTTNLSAPSCLLIFDVGTGAVLQNVTLAGAWNVYTTAWQDSSSLASYNAYGTGCAGTLGVPGLAAIGGSRPQLGGLFQAQLSNLPANVGLVATGFSDQFAGPVPLPLDLSGLGMPGCQLLADPQVVQLVIGQNQIAVWPWALPANVAYLGLRFYQQGFALDAAANPTGLTASNGVAGRIGW